jgi:hypothetical protein
MNLTHEQRKSLLAWCLSESYSIEYGKLSLCDLRNYRYSNVRNDRRYQVHCEDYQYPWSKIYDSVGPAIEKFLELKSKVKGIK